VAVGIWHLLNYEMMSSPQVLISGGFSGKWRVHPLDLDLIREMPMSRESLEIKVNELTPLTDPGLFNVSHPIGGGTINWSGDLFRATFSWDVVPTPGFRVHYSEPEPDGLSAGERSNGLEMSLDTLRVAGSPSVRIPHRDILFVLFDPGKRAVRFQRESP
jgi:hypothetical protein